MSFNWLNGYAKSLMLPNKQNILKTFILPILLCIVALCRTSTNSFFDSLMNDYGAFFKFSLTLYLWIEMKQSWRYRIAHVHASVVKHTKSNWPILLQLNYVFQHNFFVWLSNKILRCIRIKCSNIRRFG